jgi:hypothetical protein
VELSHWFKGLEGGSSQEARCAVTRHRRGRGAGLGYREGGTVRRRAQHLDVYDAAAALARHDRDAGVAACPRIDASGSGRLPGHPAQQSRAFGGGWQTDPVCDSNSDPLGRASTEALMETRGACAGQGQARQGKEEVESPDSAKEK